MMIEAMMMMMGGKAPVKIEEVFSTDLYTGTGVVQQITNGVDLLGQGGLVWTKSRNFVDNNYLIASLPSGLKELYSNSTSVLLDGGRIQSFNSNGHTLGSNAALNGATRDYVAWTFRKAEKFLM